jgi:APA family basic amino acid/polyamine antiporter
MSTESRPLGLVHVASIVIGAIVGVGIFFTPASLAKALPTPAWILGIWLLGGVVSLSGALVFAELGARFPQAGGIYVFLREGFGPRAGPPLAFLYGWIELLVVQPGSMAVIAIVLVQNVEFLSGPLPPMLEGGLAVFAILAFTGANLLGLKTGGRIQIGMAAMKLAALTVLIVIGFAYGHSEKVFVPRPEGAEGNVASWLVVGLIPVLFSFGGAYHATYVAGSVRDPERSVPRGILLGIACVLVGYLAVNVAFLGVLGHAGLASSKSPAADVAALVLGAFAGKALAVVIILSASGILNTICLGFPFVIYAMAKDGLFFERAGRLDARTGRPAAAVALQGLFACAAVVLGSAQVDVLMAGIAFLDAAFQGAVGIVHLRTRNDATRATLRAPAIASLTFLLLEGGLAIGCLFQKPRESAYGVCVLAAGAVAWRLFRGRKPAP